MSEPRRDRVRRRDRWLSEAKPDEVFFRADSHLLYPSLRGRETPVAIRLSCIADLRQICGFAGFFIVLSFIIGTPLSSLVRRKLQRSTRRRGEKNLPALRSTPLRAESFLYRSFPAAQDADLPALLMKCFVQEKQVLSPMKCDDPILLTIRRKSDSFTVRFPLSTVH